jgi:transcriptional regulator with XRE-family HTH domain
MCGMSIQIKPVVINSGEQFGQFLRSARLTASLSQSQLAHILGVAPATVGMRERGDRELSIDAGIATLTACGYAMTIVPATDVLP